MPHVRSPLVAPAFKHYLAGRLAQAETLLRRLVQRGQAPEEAPLLLAKVLLEQEKFPQAIFELERQIRAQPTNVEPLIALAGAVATAGRLDDAIQRCDEVLALAPDNVEALITRGITHFELGFPSAAEQSFGRALEVDGANPAAAVHFGQALAAQLRIADAVEFARENLRRFPGRITIQQMLAFLVLYLDDVSPEEVFREQRNAGALIANTAGALAQLNVVPDPDRRITIAYISPDLRHHPCAYFIRSLLQSRDRNNFRIIAYDAARSSDQVTRALKPLVDQWRKVSHINDADLASLIASDRVDIAIDLAGHTSGTRLAALALHPAPIAATYLGYPNSTGMNAINYRIVDKLTDPPGAEAFATEQLLRLPACFLCYTPPADAPDVAPPPSADGASITFASFNTLPKISAAAIATWSRILDAIPGSRLILKDRQLRDPAVSQHIRSLFAKRGIEAGRIETLSWIPDTRGHLAAYDRVDIALDTFPYNGTTTTCEAIWMGIPIITLEGTTHAGRVGLSLLTALGLEEFIARSTDDYIAIACRLAPDLPRRTALRTTLRQHMQSSPLCNTRTHTTHFEHALRNIWRRWCQGQGSEARVP